MATHLIVDGYNIINNWDFLKKAKSVSLDYARQRLLRLLQNYSDYTGTKVSVVFDGSRKALRDKVQDVRLEQGARRQKTGPKGLYHIEIIFTGPGHTADEMIERLVYQSPNKSSAIVATDDRCQKNLVFGMGAFTISAQKMKAMVESAITGLKVESNGRPVGWHKGLNFPG